MFLRGYFYGRFRGVLRVLVFLVRVLDIISMRVGGEFYLWFVSMRIGGFWVL